MNSLQSKHEIAIMAKMPGAREHENLCCKRCEEWVWKALGFGEILASDNREARQASSGGVVD